MNLFLRHILDRLVKSGTLKVTDARGARWVFGDGTGEPVEIRINTPHAERAIAFDPMLAFPETYMDGELDFQRGDVLALLRLAYANLGTGGSIEATWTRALDAVRLALKRLQQINTPARSRRNVQRHYDLSSDLYRLFLDEDMQYSCAYFERPDMTLEDAQVAKKRHIAAKLRVRPGQNVLDIGSGWGGMALYLAKNFDANVLGVTLSDEQHAIAVQRAQEAHLDDKVHFEIKDYRSLNERFDRIVSVGMFEHVGVNHYREFFERAARLLKPDGVIVLHSIGRFGPPAATAAFIRKHIFPGGYIPALSEVLPAIEKSGLVVADVEILRLHYAETLKAWRERFTVNRDAIRELYDERFCRMWEFYLAASEAAFRWQDLMVFQIQLTRKNDTLPITRGYAEQCEKALGVRDAAAAAPRRPASRRKAAQRDQ